MWTKAGKRLGEMDPRYQSHSTWHEHRKERREPLFLFENVIDYPIELLWDIFGDYCTIFSARVDPRRLGYAAARERTWALIVDNEKAEWDCKHSFDDLLDILAARPVMKAKDRSGTQLCVDAVVLTQLKFWVEIESI
jgi:hypothetical protein